MCAERWGYAALQLMLFASGHCIASIHHLVVNVKHLNWLPTSHCSAYFYKITKNQISESTFSIPTELEQEGSQFIFSLCCIRLIVLYVSSQKSYNPQYII